MKTARLLSLLLFAAFVLGIVASYKSVHADQTNGWAPDAKVPGYLDDTFTPFLVADQNKTVHAFATQWVGIGTDRKRAIVYRQWTVAGGWTRPIDILLSPTWDAQMLGAYLAPDGIFHLVFWGSQTESVKAGIYYSRAVAANAGDALAWSYPELIGDGAIYPCAGIISGDGQGNLVVVYNGNSEDTGIYMVHSMDAGASWSQSVPIYLTESPKYLPYYIKSYVGESGRVHVVWNVNVSEDGTYDSLYYAGIDAITGDATKPLLLDKRPDIKDYFGPSVPAVVDNGKYVMILYNGGNPFTDGDVPTGRPTILTLLSEDGGNTWDDVSAPFPFLTGQSGEQALIVDSNKDIHVVATMRIDRLIDGIYKPIGGTWHSEFVDGVWRYPERFVTSIPSVDIRAVISQGNVVMATWTEDPIFGKNGVWYTYTIIDSPELPLKPLPMPTVVDENSISGFNDNIYTETSPTVTDVPADIWENDGAPVVSPQMPILAGTIPVLIFLAVIIVRAVYLRRK